MFKKKQNIDGDSQLNKTLQEFSKGSAEAYHLLFNEYKTSVYRFCYRMMEDNEVARDAFQDTFVKVYEHCKEFKGGNFTAWLFTIARHTCLNLLRSKKEIESYDEEFHFSINEQNNTEELYMKDVIQEALSVLPIPMREALILREYDDYSYKEIADILGIEVALAKVRVYRARVILRKLLTPLKKELYES